MRIKGADVSFLDQTEVCGGRFYDHGTESDALTIMKNAGINLFRLRMWNSPEHGYCNLERTMMIARRFRELEVPWLLDLHYSDMWADPQKQFKPEQWSALDTNQLGEAVREFTRETLTRLIEADLEPCMVQTGNEITNGFLWNEGRTDGDFDTPYQWDQFADLLKQAVEGVHLAETNDKKIPVMLHIDRGGDVTGSLRFFSELEKRNVAYDRIGLSYYPFWHGNLYALSQTIESLGQKFHKPVIIAETAYPYSLQNADAGENMVRDVSQLLQGFPASPDGQAQFLKSLADVVDAVPHAEGVIYWEPARIAVPGATVWNSEGNCWDNLTLFDSDGKSLPSLEIYGRL